ncbi:altronate hydrolase [Anseongella ginsenosidimutans]|uniref:Altronate hydrolase n=1 Tax=Anseongella ginsenosidimutans TaxID=496056 RepID=A0A4R3KQA7_9SPHI|nr:altronate dehydratase family protein [Anseongella ginsenosidimutans]QEC52209.1 altronate dehydratase [Anseongella ginsenosidimutans]TCS86757.1 altronate hydrolase [Anseongella ginsenosidimutans]
MRNVLRVHASDNVLVALSDLEAGAMVGTGEDSVELRGAVPAKHKIALSAIPRGELLYMYGICVGVATEDIPAGSLITTGNVRHATGSYSVNGAGNMAWEQPDVSKWRGRTFMGYHRADGRVGTANYWIVLPLVFCENRNVDAIRDAFNDLFNPGGGLYYKRFLHELSRQHQQGKSMEELLRYELPEGGYEYPESSLFPNIDGIKFLTHAMGCGGTRDDARTLCGLLAGYITHPNVAGATVLSLGCQNAQIALLKNEIAARFPEYDRPLHFLEQQQMGSEKKMLSEALKLTYTGLIKANEQVRQPAPISKLCLGMECGGSDGFSGISANPAVGKVADKLVASGGSVILSEFPELCGVEQELSDRCVSRELAARFLELMQNYNQRAKAVGSGFDANPSPGNIRDGLVTDAIKSAGAARKGGSSPVVDVLDYPELVRKPGLNLLCTPGNDVESTTAEVAAGANIVLFTTGLGTPTGNPIAPVIKISSNTSLFRRMRDIIDIDSGSIIEGKESLDEVSDRMLEYVLEVASGNRKTKAQQLSQDDFIPWKRGVSL